MASSSVPGFMLTTAVPALASAWTLPDAVDGAQGGGDGLLAVLTHHAVYPDGPR